MDSTRNPALFSSTNPNLQLVWDATTLRSLMTCPTKYKLKALDGWRAPGSLDAEFGQHFAKGAEVYRKGRLDGKSKEEAIRQAVQVVLEDTQGKDGQADWGGSFQDVWRCTGKTPYKNAKGHKALCPWSHKGVYAPAPAPDVCGTCGSPTETSRQFVSEKTDKNRQTLIRALIWWMDDQPENPGDPGLYPLKFANGTPAVELSYQMPLPITTSTGERFVLGGYLGDSLSSFGDENFTTDNKSTKNSLDQKYFSQYSPNIQIDVYDLAGSTLYKDLNLRGVAVEGVQTLVGGARFNIGLQYRTDALREELLLDLRYYLGEAEKYAKENFWPKNRAACFLCEFKKVCSADPERRDMILKMNYEQSHWDFLKER